MVNLQLTEEEARVLSFVMASVAGDPVNSGRRVTNQIQEKLCDLKMSYTTTTEKQYPMSDKANFIVFAEKKQPK